MAVQDARIKVETSQQLYTVSKQQAMNHASVVHSMIIIGQVEQCSPSQPEYGTAGRDTNAVGAACSLGTQDVCANSCRCSAQPRALPWRLLAAEGLDAKDPSCLIHMCTIFSHDGELSPPARVDTALEQILNLHLQCYSNCVCAPAGRFHENICCCARLAANNRPCFDTGMTCSPAVPGSSFTCKRKQLITHNMWCKHGVHCGG